MYLMQYIVHVCIYKSFCQLIRIGMYLRLYISYISHSKFKNYRVTEKLSL